MITTIENLKLTAKINSKGAELISLQNQNKREYIWNGNPEFWGKHSPVLFPIVGTLKNNRYRYNNSIYQLSRHGFARDTNFDLIKYSHNQAVFSLKANNDTKKIYPFDFELQISYTLQEDTLIIGYKIINNEETELPFSIGGHPAFALPKDFKNYSLAFEQPENLLTYQLKNDLLSDKTAAITLSKNILPLTYSLFKNDALIFKSLNSRRISLLENQAPILHFNFKDFQNFGIWTKNDAAFICLEPWLGYSDTINTTGNILEKEGIQMVGAKRNFECHFSIKIV